MNERTAALLVADLMAIVRIESALNAVGFEAIKLNPPVKQEQVELGANISKPGEPIRGLDGMLIDQITKIQPELIIIDIGEAAYPWQRWLAFLKSSPASRRIPVLCYGPHVDKSGLSRAYALNANRVVTRSRFFKDISSNVLETASQGKNNISQANCSETLSDNAVKGLEEFNKGNYFDAHEYLEDAWNEETGNGRELYRAILQIAVAYLQIERANYAGAVKMILRSRQWFAQMPEICRGINLGLLQKDAETVYNILVNLGPEKITSFDLTYLNPIKFVDG